MAMTERQQRIHDTERIADFIRLHSRLIKYSIKRGDLLTAGNSAQALEEKAFEIELSL